MKINAIFEYEQFYFELAKMIGLDKNSKEEEEFTEKFQDAVFFPECYKEVSTLKIPIEVEDFNEDSPNKVFLAEKINKFAEKYNLGSIRLTESFDELNEM